MLHETAKKTRYTERKTRQQTLFHVHGKQQKITKNNKKLPFFPRPFYCSRQHQDTGLTDEEEKLFYI